MFLPSCLRLDTAQSISRCCPKAGVCLPIVHLMVCGLQVLTSIAFINLVNTDYKLETIGISIIFLLVSFLGLCAILVKHTYAILMFIVLSIIGLIGRIGASILLILRAVALTHPAERDKYSGEYAKAGKVITTVDLENAVPFLWSIAAMYLLDAVILAIAVYLQIKERKKLAKERTRMVNRVRAASIPNTGLPARTSIVSI